MQWATLSDPRKTKWNTETLSYYFNTWYRRNETFMCFDYEFGPSESKCDNSCKHETYLCNGCKEIEFCECCYHKYKSLLVCPNPKCNEYKQCRNCDEHILINSIFKTIDLCKICKLIVCDKSM